MFEQESICPYTGLRSFTEEESLYFKGREQDIDQATEQLQRNKFLMLTGASGDGKSSLIYAGIIPNARAGFLKSKYTNWCVADFRPERSPFDNLAVAIAHQLGINNHFAVRAELDHGFSAITDLYKNSARYIDTESGEWQKASDVEKAAMKREAANLIILVDQFEEFFTNPENYHNGVPSKDSNLVLNLLLETVRIALDENLPIYVVFTMRSDYIGQCAAFRGLPEYIGFSQFFVPRLNRTQLQQVIEEPALLSGNRITRRLTERLIHDLTEGVDQLPILQHALNQIWHAADNGKQEMDLLHYAMVGGMPENELPEEQVSQFREWFMKLPPEIKACYHKPDLQNVLDTHTNKLYEQANEYYFEKTQKRIPEADAKEVIRTAFTCLTKIDQSRAVRNRMTLEEITSILNKPGFGSGEVGNVLDIFREPGNTFIRPFMTDETSSQVLHKSDILDITHESLIRNWEYLGRWAKDEYDNHNVYLDFEQQLNRWLESGKASGFLLSIGPLTYFENWFNTVHPNAYWIARYLPEEIEEDKKLEKAKQQLSNAEEFLTKSARKHMVTRTVMRYGARRIVAVLAVIALITLSSFVVRDYIMKRNDQVLKTYKSEALAIANKSQLSVEYPVPVINELVMMDAVTIPEIIDGIKEPAQKIKIATGIASGLVIQGRYEPRKEIRQSLVIADSLLEQAKLDKDPKNLSDYFKLLRDYTVTLGFAQLFNTDPFLSQLNQRNADRSARWVLQIFKEQPSGFNNIQLLSLAMGHAIQNRAFNNDQLQYLLQILSPFENPARSDWVSVNYDKNKKLVRGSHDYGFIFNGLYQDLAYLYAATGNSSKALMCVDTILSYPQSFFQNEYAHHIENATNIAGVFYATGKLAALDSFVHGYCLKKNTTPVDFYSRVISRSLIDEQANPNINYYAGGGGQIFSNLNIKLCPDSTLNFFFRKLEQSILQSNNTSEQNFEHAVMLKNEILAKAYRTEIRGEKAKDEVNAQLDKAVKLYKSCPVAYLEEKINITGGGSGDPVITVPRKYLFQYPDYRVPFHPFEPRSSVFFNNSSAFVKYLLDQNQFDSIYKTPSDFRCFEAWVKDYHAHSISGDWFLHDPMPYEILEKLATKLEPVQTGQFADLNLLYLHAGDDAVSHNDQAKSIHFFKQVNPQKLLNSFQFRLYNFLNMHSFQMVAKAVATLSANGDFDDAYKFVNVFRNQVNRSSLYGYSSQLVTMKYKKPEVAARLLDSARAEMTRLNDPAVFQPNRNQVALALMYLDENKIPEANRIIKNSNDKLAVIVGYCNALGAKGKLYKAGRQVPKLLSTSEKSFLLWTTLNAYNSRNPSPPQWKKYNDNFLFFMRVYFPYINEN